MPKSEYLHPRDIIQETIIFALWSERVGPCPEDPEGKEIWRETAFHQYQHDYEFYHKVHTILYQVLSAARTLFTPTKEERERNYVFIHKGQNDE
jgi:hypothetical protein